MNKEFIIPDLVEDEDALAFRSAHTSSFPMLLDQLGISLLITTYQAGKLVVLRVRDNILNTHFRNFPKPMGLALKGPKLAVGLKNQIWEFHSNPAAAMQSEPKGLCDMCFMPRVAHFTGNMQVHEMEWVGEELWFVNTLFSCIAIRSEQFSFIPKWQPPFTTALAPEDRCHLNGLCLREGEIRYATALGQTDTPGGWRECKKNGGVLMDIQENEMLVTALSMPHSPRWHDETLWVLESGTGTIGQVDLQKRMYKPLAELPGFTRGLDFFGDIAFVGLSQVRESAYFSGISITESKQRRSCGVWAINLRNGEILGWVEFQDAVQEIFAIRVVSDARFPDLVNDDAQLLDGSFVLPTEDVRRVPRQYQSDR